MKEIVFRTYDDILSLQETWRKSLQTAYNYGNTESLSIWILSPGGSIAWQSPKSCCHTNSDTIVIRLRHLSALVTSYSRDDRPSWIGSIHHARYAYMSSSMRLLSTYLLNFIVDEFEKSDGCHVPCWTYCKDSWSQLMSVSFRQDIQWLAHVESGGHPDQRNQSINEATT